MTVGLKVKFPSSEYQEAGPWTGTREKQKKRKPVHVLSFIILTCKTFQNISLNLNRSMIYLILLEIGSNKMANSIDPDQTAQIVLSRFTLFDHPG